MNDFNETSNAINSNFEERTSSMSDYSTSTTPDETQYQENTPTITPEIVDVEILDDIDDADLHLRQAASWMEEQGLMDDVKENEFRPYRYVTKLQTCLVWDKAKEKSLIS